MRSANCLPSFLLIDNAFKHADSERIIEDQEGSFES